MYRCGQWWSEASEGGDLCQLSDFFLWKIKHLCQDGDKHIKAAVSHVVAPPLSGNLLGSDDARQRQTYGDAYVVRCIVRERNVRSPTWKIKLIYHKCSGCVTLNWMIVVEKSYRQILFIKLSLSVFLGSPCVQNKLGKLDCSMAALHFLSPLHTFLQQIRELDLMSLIRQASKGFGAPSQCSD